MKELNGRCRNGDVEMELLIKIVVAVSSEITFCGFTGDIDRNFIRFTV
jgi:hypothetical protein